MTLLRQGPSGAKQAWEMGGLLMAALLQIAAASPTDAASSEAACLIRTPTGAVMQRDVWSRRLSLPGTTLSVDGDAAAALRAMAPATLGFTLEVGPLLAADERGHRLFACTPSTQLRRQGDKLDMAAHARKVTDQLYELDPRDVAPEKWRDQHAAAAWIALCQRAMAQSAIAMVHPVDAPPLGPAMFYRELAVTQWLQAHGSPALDLLMHRLSDLGQVRVVFGVAALLWALCSWPIAAEFTFAVLLASLANCLVKDFCELPRPCYLVASLQRDPAVNFGFPSGHTMMCSTMVGLLARRSRGRLPWLLAVLAMLACGTARVYLGVHFVHDVLGAYLLAAALLAAHAIGCAASPGGFLSLRTWGWLGLGGTLLACRLALAPVSVLLIATYFGLWLHLVLRPPAAPSTPRWPPASGLEATAWGSLVAISWLSYPVLQGALGCLQPHDGSATLCALSLAMRFAAYGAWLPCLPALRRLPAARPATANLL